ncbi:large conductance mechanosensitive channel protein MscL [Serinibacter salmoneus]|uniref:Large-conductance mechanosensitive channel n=1 Tax=Serinibacter salmoneus TaxID=556530 RepID=A0A2A9D3S7_9MICO|nr:large conductance mechanosensitive channel protein MscL [Serinibacter salmoneus]PFG20500.1 large conductance mechanosensitive channel [Serinibacter salmoneus]
MTSSKILTGFKDFIARGNAVELAVGLVIGTAFTAIVTALMDGIINPLIGGIFGQPNLDDLGAFRIGSAEWVDSAGETQVGALIQPGLVLTAVVNFLIVAAALYFMVVMPLNRLAEMRKKGEEPEPEAPGEEILLLQEIRDAIKAQGSARSE